MSCAWVSCPFEGPGVVGRFCFACSYNVLLHVVVNDSTRCLVRHTAAAAFRDDECRLSAYKVRRPRHPTRLNVVWSEVTHWPVTDFAREHLPVWGGSERSGAADGCRRRRPGVMCVRVVSRGAPRGLRSREPCGPDVRGRQAVRGRDVPTVVCCRRGKDEYVLLTHDLERIHAWGSRAEMLAAEVPERPLDLADRTGSPAHRPASCRPLSLAGHRHPGR